MARHCHLIEINASADKVRTALASVEGVRGWWTEDAELSVPAPKVYSFKFGRDYANKMKVMIESEDRIQWECIEGSDEWIGTTLGFQIEAKSSDKSILRFRHEGWREESDFFAFCNTIWGYYMESIKSLCESGRGTPAPKQT